MNITEPACTSASLEYTLSKCTHYGYNMYIFYILHINTGTPLHTHFEQKNCHTVSYRRTRSDREANWRNNAPKIELFEIPFIPRVAQRHALAYAHGCREWHKHMRPGARCWRFGAQFIGNMRGRIACARVFRNCLIEWWLLVRVRRYRRRRDLVDNCVYKKILKRQNKIR